MLLPYRGSLSATVAPIAAAAASVTPIAAAGCVVPIPAPASASTIAAAALDEFENRVQAEVEEVEAMIDAGELAFIRSEASDGDVVALLQQDNIPSSDDEADAQVHHFSDDSDDDMSFDNLLSAESLVGTANHGGGAAEAPIEIGDNDAQVP